MDSEAEEEEEEGDVEADEEAAEQPTAAKGKPGKDKAGVTLEMVEGWCTAAKENATLGAVRNIIKVRCGRAGSTRLHRAAGPASSTCRHGACRQDGGEWQCIG